MVLGLLTHIYCKCKCKYVNDRFNVRNRWQSQFQPTGLPFTSLSTWSNYDQVPCFRAQAGFEPTFANCESNTPATRLTWAHMSASARANYKNINIPVQSIIHLHILISLTYHLQSHKQQYIPVLCNRDISFGFKILYIRHNFQTTSRPEYESHWAKFNIFHTKFIYRSY